MENRINLGKAAPEVFQQVTSLEKHLRQIITAAGIENGFSHLLRLRASQINQCAYCVRLHTRDSLTAGESSDRISVLPAWRETDYFTPKERASLALVEAVTLVTEGQIPDYIYEEAADALSPEEISAVEWLAIVINTWNRIAIASRYSVNV